MKGRSVLTLATLATALFDSGSSIGGAIAPFLVLWIYFRWGWRPAVAVPGALGFLWLIAWRLLYHPPEVHSRISQSEREMIAADKHEDETAQGPGERPRWRDLLRIPQTWGTIIAKTFTDPVFFFITEWFPIYLVAKGIELKTGLTAVWIPFIAADLGNFVGGAASGYLVKRGWSVIAARKAVAPKMRKPTPVSKSAVLSSGTADIACSRLIRNAAENGWPRMTDPYEAFSSTDGAGTEAPKT